MSYFDRRIDPTYLPTLCKGAVPNNPPGCVMATSGPDPHPWLHAIQADLQAILHAIGVAAAWVFQFIQGALHGVVLDVDGVVAIFAVVFVATWLREALRRLRKTPNN